MGSLQQDLAMRNWKFRNPTSGVCCTARRTAACDMAGVWQAVLQATSPKDIVDGKVPGVEAMQAARDEVTGEVNKHARAPPKFSADGKLPMAFSMC